MCAISFGHTKHCFLVICWWTFDLIILFSTIEKFMNKHVSHWLTINKHAGGRIICSSQKRAPTDRLKRAFCSVPSWKADEVDEIYLLEHQWSVFTRTWTGYEWLYHLRKCLFFHHYLSSNPQGGVSLFEPLSLPWVLCTKVFVVPTGSESFRMQRTCNKFQNMWV